MLIKLIIYSWLSGIAIFIGGLLANFFNHHIKETPIKYEITHSLMSFGAGVMLSAVALVLLPKSIPELGVVSIVLLFVGGASFFMIFDKVISRKGLKVSTLLAMMIDFIPEAMILGAVFVLEPNVAVLLAVLIGLQNLPEAFNSYRDFVQSGFTPRNTLIIFFFLSFFGTIGAVIGYTFLSFHPYLTAEIMMFASGGILYLLIQDIIPDSKMGKHYLVSMGAILGFLVGLIGEKLI